MKGVDFSQASLLSVVFRDMDLYGVRLPVAADHYVFSEFQVALEQLMQVIVGPVVNIEPNTGPYQPARDRFGTLLRRVEDVNSRSLGAYLWVTRRWAGRRGVLNKGELIKIVGEKRLNELIALLPPEWIESGR
jgi:hypothetical protein